MKFNNSKPMLLAWGIALPTLVVLGHFLPIEIVAVLIASIAGYYFNK